MKTSLATTLSVIGVLATGGVALAVNTTVLDSTVSSVEGPSPLTEALVPIAAVPVDSTMPVALATPSGTGSSVPEMAVAPASIQSAYDVQGVGIITLEHDGTSLTVVAVNPTSGWTYASTNERATRVVIKFTNGSQNVKFNAELLDGRVVTAVEATDATVTSAPKSGDSEKNESDDDDEGADEGDDD